MTTIEKLMKKYYTSKGKNPCEHEKRHKAERTSSEYWNRQRQTATQKDKQLLLDKVLNDIGQPLNPQQKTEIKTWIDTFKEDWKTLHRQSTNEAIILALIIIQYKNNHYKLTNTIKKACIDYDLDRQKFIFIQNRVIFLLMKHTTLQYTISEKYTQYIETKEKSQ